MATPNELELQRQNDAILEQLNLDAAEQNTVDAEQIQNASPSDLKAMGISKLPLLLLVVGNQVKKIINPALESLIKRFVDKYRNDKVCPTPEEIANLKNQRDNIVELLNRIAKTLSVITIALTGLSLFLTLLQSTIKSIDLAKIAAKVAAIAFPPLAATLPSTLNTLSTAKTQAIIDDEGNSKITKFKLILSGAALVSSIIGGYILLAARLLESIDFTLKECSTDDLELVPISKETQDIIDTQSQAEQSQNQTTYYGFIIEIEEVPFTPTVTRRRAVGKNAQGIKLIQTELSFTTDNQTLINELKLIIDRDNLKAY